MDLNKLEEEGFELIATVNNFNPMYVKSSKYTYKQVYYNKLTNEIKATSQTTERSRTLEHKEISLDEIRQLDDNNPAKVALKILESEEFQKNDIDSKTNKIKIFKKI